MHLGRQIIAEIKKFILLLKQGAPLDELEKARNKIRDMKRKQDELDAASGNTAVHGQP